MNSSDRLHSLDALRGFDMFWLLGGQQIVAALCTGAAAGSWAYAIRQQFSHVEWEGFRFYDFIFPLFQFLIGVAIPFALEKRLAQGIPKLAILRQASVRLLWMVVIGFFIHGNLQSWDISQMRLSYSVLQMLGLGYFIAVWCVLYLTKRGLYIATAVFLLGYWALQMFVPVPGHQGGQFLPGAILSDWLYDNSIGLLGKPWQSPWGRGFPFLPMWTHAATTLLGVFAAHILRSPALPWEKLRQLLLWGVCCLAAGWLGSFHLPIVKERWTSTFVLWCAGWSFLLLAAFWWVIDIKGWRRGFGLWTAIGSNAILAYIMASLLMGAFREIAKVFLGGLSLHLPAYWHNFVMVLASFSLAWLLLVYLRRQQIFLRL
jgi:predicted acyltransferase